MELEFITRIIKITLVAATLCFLLISLYMGLLEGLGIFAGAIWSCINLVFIKYLIQNVMVLDTRNYLKVFTLIGIKFPFLYLVGYSLLTNGYLPAWNVVIGSLLIFFVIFLNGLKGLVGKTTACVLTTFITFNLHASLDSDVPEVPNFFTLLHKTFNAQWTAFLHDWEDIIFSIMIACAISFIFYLGARRKDLIPSGIQNFVEYGVEILRKFILEILGPTGEKYVPLLGTLFLYILSMNWLAIIPLMKPPTASLNITIALAICVFVLVQYLNIKNQGLLGFLYHMAGSPKGVMGWALVPLMFPIELLTQITRPLTLALRLFGNIVGEDILIGAAALFGVILFSSSNWIGGLPMQLPFMFLALLTGLMQALVFTLLSAIYILLSMPTPEDKH